MAAALSNLVGSLRRYFMVGFNRVYRWFDRDMDHGRGAAPRVTGKPPPDSRSRTKPGSPPKRAIPA